VAAEIRHRNPTVLASFKEFEWEVFAALIAISMFEMESVERKDIAKILFFVVTLARFLRYVNGLWLEYR
jgi:hypothetical protein